MSDPTDTIAVKFDQDDINDLMTLIDVALRAAGIQAARPAGKLIAKLDAAKLHADTIKAAKAAKEA